MGPFQGSTHYINEVRLGQFISASVYQGLKWVAFTPDGPQLWAKMSSEITAFMDSLVSQGALGAISPSRSFLVIVNESNNPLPDIEAGLVHIDIAFKPQDGDQLIPIQLTVQAGRGL